MPLYEHPLDNPFLHDLYMEGLEKGLEKGREEGREEGREKATRVITHILERRFGPLPAWAQEKIRALPVEKLENLLDQALDAPTLEHALDV